MKKKETKHEFEKRKKKAIIINNELKKLFGSPKTVLNHSNPLELLISVILSAQCTDKKVNEVTEKLFKKYTTLQDYLNAKPGEFEQDIRSTGFYKAKTRNILKTVRMINDQFSGKVPHTMEDLTSLAGVARKTANIVLGNVYGIVEGIAVDTHVKRLSLKFGLTDETDPVKIERDLMDVLPKSEWFDFTYRLIEYGRNYSTSWQKKSNEDPISKLLSDVSSKS